MKKIYSLSSLLALFIAVSISVKAQVITVYNNNFNVASFTTGNTYGTPAELYTFTQATGGTIGTTLVSGSNYVANINAGTSGTSGLAGTLRSLFYSPIAGYSAPFTTTLSSNPGVVTWTFNMQTSVAATNTGPLAGSTGGGIDLVGNMAGNIYNGAPNGYGVVFNSSATGGVSLVRFSAGMATNVALITETTTMPPTDYYSVKVTYNPATNAWSLFVRDDGSAGFADPSSGVTLQQGTTVIDATNTGLVMVNYGAVYTFPAGVGTMSVDNYTVSVTLCNPPGTITGSTPICNGGTLSLSDATGFAGGTWSSSNTSVATVGSTGLATSTGAGLTTITYTIPFPCGGLSATTVVTVNPLPNAIGGTTSACAGATVTLTETSTGGTWSIGNPSVATVDGFGNVTGVALGNTVVTYTLPTTCATNTPITVNVNPGAITGTATVCQGASTTLFEVVTGGTWSSGAGSIATVDAFGDVFGVTTASGPSNIVYTLPTGCNAARVVTVNVLPTQFAVSTIGNPTYCAGTSNTASIILSSSTSGVRYQLFDGAPAVGSPLPGGTGLLNFGVPSVPGTYTVVATNTTTGCVNNMVGTAVIASKPLPALFNVTHIGSSFCFGGAGIVVGLDGSASGVTYQLDKDGVPVPSVSLLGTGLPLSFGAQFISGIYTVVATENGAAPNCSLVMNGNAIVQVNALPEINNITGGGEFCPGGAGVEIGLDYSNSGVSYQLTLAGASVGSPVLGIDGTISFGLQTGIGSTYGVVATNIATGCTSNMAGSASVSYAVPPTVYDVTGGGNYCAGGTGYAVGISGSDAGVNYQLYNGSSPVGAPVAGMPGAFDFDVFTTPGDYKVVATDQIYHCVSNMSDSAVINVLPVPTIYTVSGGGGYCAGGPGLPATLSGSQSGITYTLFNGAIAVESLAGTGSPLNFGSYTTAGSYSVLAVDSPTTCSSNMFGSAIIAVNPVPVAFNVTGGGSYCAGGAGVDVGLDFSTIGVNYQLFKNGFSASAPVEGIGDSLDFGLQTASGTYTIVGTYISAPCASNMSGSATVSVNPLPAAHAVTGGGSYCGGGLGMPVNIAGSDAGVNYQLYDGFASVGIAVGGTGSGFSFGSQTTPGIYTVTAMDTTTMCSANMLGAATITLSAAPAVFAVTGGGSVCGGTPGAHIGLSNSNAGIQYLLYNGSTLTNTLTGSGTALDFGLVTSGGVYTITGTNTATGCSNVMDGNAIIIFNPAPAVYPVIGGGSYCAGTTTLPSIGLGSSGAGINYQLYMGGTAIGSAVTGTGAVIDFGAQSAAGTYTIIGTDTITGCSKEMSGSAAVSINSLPSVYTVTGGGGYCAGGAGHHIYMSVSNSGIQYVLYLGGFAVDTVAGTGAGLDMGLQTSGGAYTVVATNSATGCTSNMAGSATITINSLPVIHTVTVADGGDYCVTGSGVHVGLDESDNSISYQLYNGSATAGSTVSGTGGAIDFGVHPTGDYTAVATNSTTGCMSNMAGSAMVNTIPLPNVYATIGGGNYCSPGVGLHIGLSGSDSGTQYQLYHGSSAIGGSVTSASSGSAVDFGLFTSAGAYTVVGTNGGVAGCSNNMGGAAVIAVYPVVLPVSVITATGGDTACFGNITLFTASSFNGGTSPVYNWMVNGVPVAAGSNYSYLPVDGDMVTLTLESNAICAIPDTASSTIRMSVSPLQAPSVNIMATPGDTVCQGSPITFTGTSLYGGPHPVYTWIKNSTFVVGIGATYSYTPANGDIIMLRMLSDFPCRLADTVFSNTNTIEVDSPLIPIVTILANPGLQIAAGQSVTFNASVLHGGPTPVYQWLINGNGVSGATNASFTTSSLSDNDSVSCVVLGGCDIQGFNSVRINVSSEGVQQTTASGNSNIVLVPNPNKGAFTIKGTTGNATDEEVSVEVVNMLGQVVYSTSVATRNGNINEKIQIGSSLPNGIYLLNLQSASRNNVFHFVIEQ